MQIGSFSLQRYNNHPRRRIHNLLDLAWPQGRGQKIWRHMFTQTRGGGTELLSMTLFERDTWIQDLNLSASGVMPAELLGRSSMVRRIRSPGSSNHMEYMGASTYKAKFTSSNNTNYKVHEENLKNVIVMDLPEQVKLESWNPSTTIHEWWTRLS
uniref:Uncharacterized protein n=1 Tax=Oryza meridionalis TaxID=40149 RepID=A0A0E0F901_9ORYZ